MTLVPDEYVFAPAIEREFAPLFARELPGAVLHSDGHDLFVTVPGTELLPIEVAYRLVREMRGGRDHDGARPADWHVRSFQAERDIPEQPCGRTGPWPIVGTGIWFSRSYTLPEGYDENDELRRTLTAPGAMAPRA